MGSVPPGHRVQPVLLTVDTGSSSVKLAAFDLPSAPGAYSRAQALIAIASEHVELAGDPESNAFSGILRSFLDRNAIGDVRGVAHRIVHGGTRFSASLLLDAEVEHDLRALSDLAPLHLPLSLDWIALCRSVLGATVPQIAVFDTAFFADLPPVARHYAIPRELEEKHGIRRYGFHGLAHESMLTVVQQLRPDLDRGGRLISIQLGAGCSAAAIERGMARDTSMGFSPLEGLVMATRSGDIDPGLLTYLERTAEFSAEMLERVLNMESGLLGVSGISGDMRTLLSSDSEDAEFAVELYCYRVRKYIGAYLAVLGGADVIVFGGGVGEHAPRIRERILSGMEWCGIVLDRERNDAVQSATTTGESGRRISASSSPVDIWVASVDESAVLAREAEMVLHGLISTPPTQP